jgi:predicted NAD-dependent protein-ADP-ribosyltransferase YbiA (DUF1768 family)
LAGRSGIIVSPVTKSSRGGRGKGSEMVKEIRFYRARGKYGFLSNLYPCRVSYFSIGSFASAEHAYQWFKAKDEKTREWIRQAPYPRLAAIAGHGLFFYDINPNWNKYNSGEGIGLRDKGDESLRYKVVIMRNVLLTKFGQNPALADKLLATGDAILIEDSKTDAYWGVGKKGNGQNWLGKCLMDIRELLRKKEEERSVGE